MEDRGSLCAAPLSSILDPLSSILYLRSSILDPPCVEAHHIAQFEADREVAQAQTVADGFEQVRRRSGMGSEAVNKKPQAKRLAPASKLADLEPAAFAKPGNRPRGEEENVVWDELAPPRPQQPIPEGRDVRRFEYQPPARLDDTAQFAQFLAGARDVFDDVVHRGGVEMPVREARVAERPAEDVQTLGAGRAAGPFVGLDAYRRE